MNSGGQIPDWIAVDWGTTRLRVWCMSQNGDVLSRHDSDQGMSRLAPDAFAPTLHALLSESLNARRDEGLPVVICGMAGARQGWVEVPYAAAPCAPPRMAEATVLQSEGMQVHILPGVSQAAPADVMRGEETQIAGFLSREPRFDGVLCLPGTHSKWVRISAGEIVSFQTFMTGELFGLLSGNSVLRHAIEAGGWDQAAFDQAVADTLTRPADLAARLFAIRAETLLSGLSGASARARLSGLLIGAELAASRPYWLGQDIALIGTGALTSAYKAALAAQAVQPRLYDAETLVLAGLSAAYHAGTETRT